MEHTHPPFVLLVVGIAAITLLPVYVRYLLLWRARTKGRPLPPGPRGLPLLGNFFELPRFKPWRDYCELRRRYGDLVYLEVLGSPIIVVGSAQVANELLDKRSANTTDRPLSLVTELSGQDLNFALHPHGLWWRRHRRAFWQHFHPGTITRYLPGQRENAHRFLAILLSSPSQIRENIRFSVQSTILNAVYGVNIVDAADSRLSIAHNALEAIAEATPGHFAVEFFPFLRHVPAWFPGAGFQQILARSRVANYRLKHELFDEVKEAWVRMLSELLLGTPYMTCIMRGEDHPCVASDLLNRIKTEGDSELTLDREEEDIMKNVCAVAIEGSSDTTGNTLEAFFVAMALFPEAQKKAQAELDSVVGPDRLPDHSDSEDLVYINAVVKEIVRWHLALPIGIPHRTVEDDELYGYFIPGGSTIITNVWGILHDPDIYDNPHEFRPERFITASSGKLDPTVPDPTAFMFGFGRRICPGRHLAIPSLFINIASVLHVFNISLPVDENGQPIHIVYEPQHGLTSAPEDCRCTIKPRSAAAEALIREAQH